MGWTLIPPAYVKPFVKRQKTDAADAEARGDLPEMRGSARGAQLRGRGRPGGGLAERGAPLGRGTAASFSTA
jgi:hypothetical protein